MTLTTENALWGHVDEATAYVVDDYPYGFRLRTKIRYWIETNAKHGDRLVSQTLNPKVEGEKWNKPKKSTYSLVGVMYLDEQGHVTWDGLSVYSDLEEIEAMIEVTDGKLNDDQRKQVARLLGARRAWKLSGAKVVVSSAASMTDEEQAEYDAKQKEIEQWLGRLWQRETGEAKRQLEAIADGIGEA